MEPIKFVIWARKTSGEEFACFHWSRDKESGISRAWRDSANFEVSLALVWAVPYVEET